ncbi:MAG TPA: hypothetical protein DCZ10_09865, partial [Pelotomaculum sp.]|nr:hypothetical protein [Pelotomaculum sp.]
ALREEGLYQKCKQQERLHPWCREPAVKGEKQVWQPFFLESKGFGNHGQETLSFWVEPESSTQKRSTS